jgi:small-conductance mechanosensitive channel
MGHSASRWAAKAIVGSLLLTLWIGLADGSAQTSPPASVQPQDGYPVDIDGREILRIYDGVGSFTARDRAEAVADRLQKLVKDPRVDVNNIKVADSPFGSSIELGDNVLLVVTDHDATRQQVSRNALAYYYLKQIRQGILEARNQHTRGFLIRAAIYALVTLLVYLCLLWVVVVGIRRLLLLLEPAAGRMKGIKIQQTELLPGWRIASFIAATLRTLRVVLLFALTWIFLATVANYFPWTREHGKVLQNYIRTPVLFVIHSVLNYLPNLFYIIVIVTVMFYGLKFVRVLAREVERGNIRISGFYPEWVQPTYKIVRFLLIALTAVIIYPYLPGENSPAFKGIGLFIGVLFSLGSTSAVANVIAGVIIIYARGFRVSDWVKIGDNVGEITSLTMLATHLQTIRNEEIIIPNSVVLNSYVTNYSMLARTKGLILHTTITIGYDAPWRKIHDLLIEAACTTKHVLAVPPPFVLQTSLENSYVAYDVNVYTDQPKQMIFIYSDLNANIQDCFFAAGVEIMSPVYSALRDGNRTQIPDEFLPTGYKPQGFRVERSDAASAASANKP